MHTYKRIDTSPMQKETPKPLPSLQGPAPCPTLQLYLLPPPSRTHSGSATPHFLGALPLQFPLAGTFYLQFFTQLAFSFQLCISSNVTSTEKSSLITPNTPCSFALLYFCDSTEYFRYNLIYFLISLLAFFSPLQNVL